MTTLAQENETRRMEVYSIEDDEELERIRMSIVDMGETGEYTGTPKGDKRELNVQDIMIIPEDLEKDILRRYFSYKDIGYLSLVCKRWKTINDEYFTEVKNFLNEAFKLSIQTASAIDGLSSLELKNMGGRRRHWNLKNLTDFKINQIIPSPCLDPNYIRDVWCFPFDNINFIRRFAIGKIIQLEFIPGDYRSEHLNPKRLDALKKKIQQLKKKMIKDKKNKKIKIQLHKRGTYTEGTISLLIWKN